LRNQPSHVSARIRGPRDCRAKRGGAARKPARSKDRRSRSLAPLPHQTAKPLSPLFETASAIQARARAVSAMRSAGQEVLSVKPPASTYCRAIALSERQWVESSYFVPRSSTSALQRFTVSCSFFAIGSSFDSLEEHPPTKSGSRRSGAIRLLRIIFLPLGDEARPMRATGNSRRRRDVPPKSRRAATTCPRRDKCLQRGLARLLYPGAAHRISPL
jgi:hypothetical protein